MDERFETVEQAIRDTLFLLAKQKDPETITVTELCRKAGIVRSAFYNHYEDLPSLIEAVLNQSVEEIFRMMEEYQAKESFGMSEGFYLSLCRNLAENTLLQQFLKWPGESKTFFERALSMFYGYALHRSGRSDEQELSSREDFYAEDLPAEVSYAIAYAIGGAAGILHHWVTEGMTTPAEKIAASLTELFERGPLGVLEKGKRK